MRKVHDSSGWKRGLGWSEGRWLWDYVDLHFRRQNSMWSLCEMLMVGITEKKLPWTNFPGFSWHCTGNWKEGSEDRPAVILTENLSNLTHPCRVGLGKGKPFEWLLSSVLNTKQRSLEEETRWGQGWCLQFRV